MSGTTSHHYEKRWAIVTGASSGIVRAFTRELASRGYSVLAVARRRDRLDAVAKEAADRGATVEPIVADLETEAGVASVMRRVEAIGPVELLVNNAGTSAAGDFLDTPFAEQTGAIRLNVEALVSLTRQILKGMVQRKCGAVINLASVVAFQPFPHFAVYAATKAFVALCPGAVRTEMDVFSGNEGLLGKLPSLSAEQVVKSGLHALEHGSVVKVVGTFNHFLPFVDRLLSRRAVRWLMGASARPPRPVSSSEVSL